MTDPVEVVRGERITIRFEAAKCVHSRNCVLGHPAVFVPNAQGAWIHPDAASAETVVALAHNCPSGAITYERHDGGDAESPPPVNTVRVRENGPLAFHAALRIAGEPAALRATLCRCGASKNKPYCDGSHTAAAFTATGEPPTKDTPALAVRNGPVAVTPMANGSLHVVGNIEVVSGTGRTLQKLTECWLCRCGASANKPFCDGSHRKAGFTAAGKS
jgi:CDGSH-type Zn-finger protein/uncharacterized Fe-S cluster protein YjdI